ncbi:MAG: hypothetical protein IKA99_07620 [Clostridia bacterium]|nr:hypothetical protein [Clostridia bacterium]
MKKLLIGLMCLLMVTFTTIGLVGCKKTGNTSTKESVSVESVSQESESVFESVVESSSATCSHALTVLQKDGEFHWYECECGEQSGNKEAHDFDEGVVTKQPTETEEGVLLLTCQVCGETTTTSIPTVGHVHSLEKVDGTPATCSEDGVKDTWYCDGCQKSYLDVNAEQEVANEEALVIPAINHANEAFSHRVAPRCGVAGADVYVCPDCQTQREVPIDALEHDWKNVETVEATCEHGGYVLQKCANCQNEQKVNETGITDCDEEYVVVTESDCEHEGLAKYVCKNCQAEREITLSKCEHEMEAIETVAPTCTEDGYTTYKCKNCVHNYKDDVVESLGGHDYVVDTANSYDATCLNSGLTVYVCSRGCEEARYSEEIEALGHDEVAPTCTEEGYCTRCDDVRVAKIPHELEVIEDVAPTCTEDGYVTYGCKHCDYTEEKVPESYKATGHAEDDIEWVEVEKREDGETCWYHVETSGVCPTCQTTIVKTGDAYESHTYTCTITTPATCVSEGVKTYTCVCSHSYTENYDIDESAHKLDAGVQDGNYLVYTCQNGGCLHTESVLHIVEDEVDANVVKDAEKLSVGDATLKLDEQTKGQIGEGSSVSLSAGTLDGAELDEAKGKLNEDQLALLGDSEIYNFEMQVDGEAVTQFNGYITIRIPYDLDGQDPEDIVIWYIEGETPVLIEARYIEIDGQGYAEFETNHFSYYSVAKMSPQERCAIYGHYTEGSVTVLPATCLEGGYTLTVCRRCGYKEYSNRVPALGHNWAEREDLHVDVSCTQDGYEKHECTRCQVAYEVKTQAHGHKWHRNEERTEIPTCEKEGKVVYECEHCDNEYFITEKKTAHKYNTNVVASTCTTAGYTECTCKDCGYVTTKNPTPALGHSIVDEVHAPTCISKGYTSHKCSRCDAIFANTDYTDEVDHEWDREEPTCEEDKLCKHCRKRDENNGKAKGHYMEDGKCKHCNKPCNHTFKYSHTIESTCAGVGYEVWVCKHCQVSEYRGETGVASHDFALLREVAPTCQTAGYKVEVCRACGFTQTTETTPAVDHSFVNGKCVYCGLVHQVEAGYIDVIQTLQGVNGISIKIDNVSYELFEIVEGEKELEGEVKSLQAVEMMLYVEDGQIHGAVIGAIQIFNGPVANGYASFAFKGIVENENLYILVGVEESNNYEISIKYAIDEIFGSIIGEMMPSDSLNVLTESGILDLVKDLVDANAPAINKAISKVVSILFTPETVDGETVYTLDFEKVRALNDDLAHLSIKDTLGKHFGEEFLPNVKKLASEIVNLKVKDLPAYLTEKGLPTDAIFDVVNNIAKLQGAPDDYDVRAIFDAPEAETYTVGDVIFGEDASFVEVIKQIEELQGLPAYLLLLGDSSEEEVEQVYQMVNMVVEMLEGINVGFTTDSNGVITKAHVCAKDFVVNMPDMEFELSLDVEVAINGTIDVTWDDIIGDIEEEIVLPEGLEDQENVEYSDQNTDRGWIEIDGCEYEYQAMVFYQYVSIHRYSSIAGAIAKKDCGDWTEYMILVPYERQNVSIALFAIMEEAKKEEEKYESVEQESPANVQYFFVLDRNIEERIPATINADGTISANGVNGNLVTISLLDLTLNNINVIELKNQLFGSVGGDSVPSGITTESVYYNKVTGEYDGESHHNFVLNEENSYEPAGCLQEGLNYYECTECGEVYRDVYRKYHNTKMEFKLSEGSTCCEDGIDAYWICTECNEITDYEYNWGYGCHYTHEKVFEDGVAKQKEQCSACGQGTVREVFTLDSDFNLEYYTGPWGKPSSGKPNTGIGGGSMGEAVAKEDGFTFKFVPTQDVTVEFYSKTSNNNSWTDFFASIYDSEFKCLIRENGNLDNGNFGIVFSFEAGQTYYVVANHHNYYVGTKYTVLFKEAEVETVNLADYGCECGGEMVITSAFGKKDYQVNVNCGVGEWEACQSCGFGYYVDSRWGMNENCEEIESLVAHFCNERSQESYQYVIYEYKTGSVKHNENGERIDESYETVDENGNPITVVKEGWVYTCENCGQVVSSSIYEYHNNENGDQIYYSHANSYWSTAKGEIVLYEKSEVWCNTDGRETARKETRYDELGEEETWTLTEYSYYAENPCKTTRKVTYSYGKGYEETYYDHWHSEKELPDESYEEETWLDGVLVTKSVVAIETYCNRCYASIRKRIYVTYTDENGNCVKEEYYYYEQYAESQDVYGWELISSNVNTYGVAKYSFRYFTYLTSEENVRYFKDSRGQEIESYYKIIYEYVDPTSSCEVIIYNVDQFGNVHKENDEWSDEYYEKEDGYIEKDEYYDKEDFYAPNVRHIAPDRVVLLQEGATSCTEGLAYYEVCYICGMRRNSGSYWNNSHRTDEYDVHLDNVEEYHLKDYGQVCDGVIHVVTCPCGVDKEVYFRGEGCDFASFTNHYGNHDNKYSHWYYEYNCAVSEPMCGFAYSFEHWDTRGANCARIYNKKWVFGLNSENQLVIECSYATGDYFHDYESISLAESKFNEDGYIVYYSGYENVCTICSHVGEKYEYWEYYSVNPDGEETHAKSKYLDTYYYEFGDRIIRRTEESEYGLIFHPNGERSAWVKFVEKETNYDSYGNMDYWYQNTYNYDSCIHTPVRTYENSDGEHDVYQEEHDYHEYYHDGYVITPTCTQSGIEHRTCDWCYASRDYDHGCFGHDYYETWDEEMQQYVYYCDRCGLINFTGHDGNVILEDMTNAEEGVFTVGYYFHSYFEYIIAVSLVVEGQEEPIILLVDAYDDGNSLITVSFEDVISACEEEGLEFEDVMVKVTILPVNGDYSFDYSVTMDSHQGV